MKFVTEAMLAPMSYPDSGNVYSEDALRKAAVKYGRCPNVTVVCDGQFKIGKLLSVRVLNGNLEGVVELDSETA